MDRTMVLMLLPASTPMAQINAGNLPPTAATPFQMTKVGEFALPWRMAFLPDARMLITDKGGKLFLVTPNGEKTEVTGDPPVLFEKQNCLPGVSLSPGY